MINHNNTAIDLVYHNLSVSVIIDLTDEVSEFLLLELRCTGRHKSRADHQTVHCKP